MLYLLWALLNIALICYFLFLCFNAVKLVRERLGLFSAIALAIGFLSLSYTSPESKTETKKISGTWENGFDSIPPIKRERITKTLTDNIMFSIDLRLQYVKDDSLGTIPVFASFGLDGTTMGLEWQSESINIAASDNRKRVHYTAYGTLKWKLLRGVAYSQNKFFEGDIDLE